MIPYNKRFIPPAPVINVVCVNPHLDRAQSEVSALLDTGADITALPRSLIIDLGLEVKRAIEVAGLENERVEVAIYEMNVEIAENRMERLEVIEWEGDFVVLGRDVLNEFYIILDGQMKQFEMRAM